MKLGKLGVWNAMDSMSAADGAAFAKRVEAWATARCGCRTVARGDEAAIRARIQEHWDAGADNKRLGPVLAMIREQQLRREPQHRSQRAPRRRDQRDARLFKVG